MAVSGDVPWMLQIVHSFTHRSHRGARQTPSYSTVTTVALLNCYRYLGWARCCRISTVTTVVTTHQKVQNNNTVAAWERLDDPLQGGEGWGCGGEWCAGLRGGVVCWAAGGWATGGGR
jgi:hypothetical protein